MKQLIVFVSAFATSWLCYGLPATALVCNSDDGDLQIEAIIHLPTGDLYPDTLKIYENGVQKAPAVKQYRNYDYDIFILASLGPQQSYDDVGYIIDLSKTYRDPTRASGKSEKYTLDPNDQNRKIVSGSYQRLTCKIGVP